MKEFPFQVCLWNESAVCNVICVQKWNLVAAFKHQKLLTSNNLLSSPHKQYLHGRDKVQ